MQGRMIVGEVRYLSLMPAQCPQWLPIYPPHGTARHLPPVAHIHTYIYIYPTETHKAERGTDRDTDGQRIQTDTHARVRRHTHTRDDNVTSGLTSRPTDSFQLPPLRSPSEGAQKKLKPIHDRITVRPLHSPTARAFEGDPNISKQYVTTPRDTICLFA